MLEPNTYVRPIYFEPVSGTGERLAVGALVSGQGLIEAKRIIRDDSLEAMYGSKGANLANLIDFGLMTLAKLADDRLEQAPPPVAGLEAGEARHIFAASMADAFRTCVLMFSSLGSLQAWDEEQDENEDRAESASKLFYTRVRDATVALRPDFLGAFGRKVTLRASGKPMRMGFINERAVFQFGVLSPTNQHYGFRDAQSKLWQLYCVKDYARLPVAALIFGVPREDDPTLSDRARRSIQADISEIEMEADSYGLRFLPMTTVDAAAQEVISRAA
jgi:hypothetical protein